MGMKERRDSEKMQMKRNIINAAIQIMEQEGYEQLSIRKIASKIEYSPTTIYLYYKDKAEIIKDISDHLYDKVTCSVNSFINENTLLSADQQVRNVMRIFIKELCSEPEMVKAVMFSGINVIFANDSTDGKSNDGIHLLDHLLSMGIGQKVFRPDIENASWMIISALLGFIMNSVTNQLNLHDSFDRLTDDFAEMILRGIKQ